MSAPHVAPRYAIHFYDYKWITANGKDHSIRSMRLIDEVAIRLKVTPEQIIEAFQFWAVSGYPQEYFMKIGSGIKSRGGVYDIGVHIWNYQGGNPGDSGPPHPMGVLSKSRVWGKGYQQIDTCRESFYLGPLA